MAARKGVICDCGMEMRAPAEEIDALVDSAKHHAKSRHNMDAKDADVRRMIKDVR